MATGGLPEALLEFIQLCVPSFEAAELLMFLSRHPEKTRLPAEIAEEMRPNIIAPVKINELLALFKARGLVTETAVGFQFAPTSPELSAGVAILTTAYEERPVTLIRAINTIADRNLQSFSDSFKFKRE